MIEQATLSFLILFAGFAIGRIGHIYGGHIEGLDHWIYGLVLMAIGAYFLHTELGIATLIFGVGVFVSDLKDFLNGKWHGPDQVEVKRFWHID